MLTGIWPIVGATLGELIGMALFVAGYWLMNDLRGELLGRKPDQPQKDQLFPGIVCVVAGLVLAFGMFPVQVAAAGITMLVLLFAALVVSHVLLKRKRIQDHTEFTELLRELPEDPD